MASVPDDDIISQFSGGSQSQKDPDLPASAPSVLLASGSVSFEEWTRLGAVGGPAAASKRTRGLPKSPAALGRHRPLATPVRRGGGRTSDGRVSDKSMNSEQRHGRVMCSPVALTGSQSRLAHKHGRQLPSDPRPLPQERRRQKQVGIEQEAVRRARAALQTQQKEQHFAKEREDKHHKALEHVPQHTVAAQIDSEEDVLRRVMRVAKMKAEKEAEEEAALRILRKVRQERANVDAEWAKACEGVKVDQGCMPELECGSACGGRGSYGEQVLVHQKPNNAAWQPALREDQSNAAAVSSHEEGPDNLVLRPRVAVMENSQHDFRHQPSSTLLLPAPPQQQPEEQATLAQMKPAFAERHPGGHVIQHSSTCYEQPLHGNACMQGSAVGRIADCAPSESVPVTAKEMASQLVQSVANLSEKSGSLPADAALAAVATSDLPPKSVSQRKRSRHVTEHIIAPPSVEPLQRSVTRVKRICSAVCEIASAAAVAKPSEMLASQGTRARRVAGEALRSLFAVPPLRPPQLLSRQPQPAGGQR